MKNRILLSVLFVAVIIAGRMMPHAANFTPVASVLLLSAALLNRRNAVMIFLLGMFVSDALLGFYNVYGMLCNYLGLAAVLLATYLPGLKSGGLKGAASIGLASLSGSVLFYVVSNFGVWAFSGMYTHDLPGLAYCYELALPFFRNSLSGDLFYNTIFFGAAAGITMLHTKLIPARIR